MLPLPRKAHLGRKNAYPKYYVSFIYSNFDMAPYMLVELKS